MKSCKNNTKISHLSLTQIHYFLKPIRNNLHTLYYLYFLIILYVFPKNKAILLCRELYFDATLLSKLRPRFQFWQLSQ